MHPALKGIQVIRGHKVLKETLVHLAPKEIKVRRGFVANLAPKENKDRLVSLAQRVTLARLGHKVLKGTLARLVPKENKGLPVSLGQKVTAAKWGHEAQGAILEHQVKEAPLVSLAQRVIQARKVLRETLLLHRYRLLLLLLYKF